MKLTNWLLAVAVGSSVLAAPKTPAAKVTIDCAKKNDPAPSCEVKRRETSSRPDLFHGAKPKARAVRL